jgi:hypothetical protein
MGVYDYIYVAQKRERYAFVNTVMNLTVPYDLGNLLTSPVAINFSRKTLLHGANQSVTFLTCVP